MIDTLEIVFPLSRLARSLSTGPNQNPYRVDMTDVILTLERHGYRPIPRHRRGNRHRYQIYDAQGRSLHITIHGKGDDNYMYLDKIVAYPMRLPSMRVFWSVIQAMDSHGDIQNGVIAWGCIGRIDYACDYRVSTQRIMAGLYAVRGRRFTVLTDDDEVHLEHDWDRGMFNSFRIGNRYKLLRVYDKALEQARRHVDTGRARTAAARVEADLADYYGRNEEDEQVDEFEAEEVTRVESAAARHTAWTRIERSILQTSNILGFWNTSSPDAEYRGRLSELPSHLQDIQDGRCLPFENVILHHVCFRGTQFRKDRVALGIRARIEDGFLMRIYKILGGHHHFWREHRLYFSLIPWQRRYQPSSIYQDLMRRWIGGVYFNPRGGRAGPKAHQGMQPADRWRTDLTTGNVEPLPEHEAGDIFRAA